MLGFLLYHVNQPGANNRAFVIDTGVMSDVSGNGASCAMVASAAQDSSMKMDGKPSTKIATGASKLRITLPKNWNTLFSSGNWTVEWSAYNSEGTVSDVYATDIQVSGNVLDIGVSTITTLTGLLANQCIGTNLGGTKVSFWRLPVTKTAAYKKLIRYCMQMQDGQLIFYMDGQKQTVSTIALTVATTPGTPMSGAAVYYGNVRVSNFARYKANYTPIPF